MTKPNVYSTRVFVDAPMARAQEVFNFTVNPDDTEMSRDAILAVAGDVDAFMCSSGDDFSAHTIMALPDNVQCISTVSVGYDHIDVDACRKRGIRVGNTPGVLEDATADIAWLCLMGAARLAQSSEMALRTGQWQGFEPNGFIGTDIRGKRLGILGMGGVGRAVAKRAMGWDMEIHYHNRNRLSPELEQGAIYHDNPDSLFAVSDFLSLNCPLTPETTGIVNTKTIDILPQGAVVVNTARGPVVDDDALIFALQSGRVFAAGLDVFTGEPHFDKRYLDLDNVFLLPHIGSATAQTRTDMGNMAIDNILRVMAGEDMLSEVV